ncbi:hypothetical protein [Flaviflexus huanghaiensis]|uniref:baeRF11 domain-containing protein n=1 Tax=Flaviflexus huanghaiensis TaxID=1111473 RepID=UPI0015FD63F9
MALHTDIPTSTDIERLAAARHDYCVSIYVPTSPITQDTETARLELRNAADDAYRQLTDAGLSRQEAEAITGHVDALTSDGLFWAYMSHSLAVFFSSDGVATFRLPNLLTSTVQVSDRFHIKPLLRAVTFPHTAFVLALSQNAARLIEITADSPAFDVEVQDMPTSLEDAVGRFDDANRSSFDRMDYGVMKQVRLPQYARMVDQAVRPVLAGGERPLILAAAEPLAGIYRSVSSTTKLASHGIDGNPDDRDNTELSNAARSILDEIYADDIAQVREDLLENYPRDRVAFDSARIARAATFGAVDTLLVDIDNHQAGFLDEADGKLTFGDENDTRYYGISDEIARRALRTGARVLAVRAEDIPEGGPVAALLRYPI